MLVSQGKKEKVEMCNTIKKLKEIIESEMKKSSKVFIVGHNGPDFDSVGSAVGLYTLAKHFGKKAYIIINESDVEIEPGVKKILDDYRDHFKIITKADFEQLVDSDSLLVLTDVNKDNMICVGDQLDKVKSIVVIDHHNENEHTIKKAKKFIDLEISSASEIVSRLLLDFRVKFGSDVANFLLAGINLDTKRFKDNTKSQTHDIAKKLMNRGAETSYVNNLFLEEFESFCRISNLIINGTIIKKYSDTLSPIQISFTLNRNSPKEIYRKEDYAKAAERMMKFNGIDAAFALGYVTEQDVHISARGGQRVNVGKIMQKMQGGGNNKSAGSRITTDDIASLEEELMEKVLESITNSEEEAVFEEPEVIKVKQIKKK